MYPFDMIITENNWPFLRIRRVAKSGSPIKTSPKPSDKLFRLQVRLNYSRHVPRVSRLCRHVSKQLGDTRGHAGSERKFRKVKSLKRPTSIGFDTPCVFIVEAGGLRLNRPYKPFWFYFNTKTDHFYFFILFFFIVRKIRVA